MQVRSRWCLGACMDREFHLDPGTPGSHLDPPGSRQNVKKLKKVMGEAPEKVQAPPGRTFEVVTECGFRFSVPEGLRERVSLNSSLVYVYGATKKDGILRRSPVYQRLSAGSSRIRGKAPGRARCRSHVHHCGNSRVLDLRGSQTASLVCSYDTCRSTMAPLNCDRSVY